LLALLIGGCVRPPAKRALSPRRGEWTRVGAIRRFTADNLYEVINGEAPLVISFGFRSLARAEYTREDKAGLTVDLYDMGSTDNAFALFRSHADLDAQPLDVGTEGAGDDTRVEFWQGRFYVLVAAHIADETPNISPAARELAGDLPPTAAWSAYLDWLPQGGRIARSEQYAPSDFLGQEFLKRAVSARYNVGSREAMVFASRCDSPSDAKRALALLETELGGNRAADPLDLGEESFVGKAPYHGPMAVFRRERFLGGMTGYRPCPAADRLLVELDRRLSAR
jgi:hypothetical protein